MVPNRPKEEVAPGESSVPADPHLFLREVVVALVLLAFILVLSMVFDAPLGSEANPGLSPNPTKAP